MNSIEAFQQDILYQLTDLKKLSFNISQMDFETQRQSIITGAGDSYCVALVTQCASDNRIQCIDPLDICRKPSILINKTLFTVSVSGSTKANIAAAAIARKLGRKTVTLTSNPTSRLARICNEVIEVKFRSCGILTSGSIGFSTFTLACLHFLKKVKLGNVGHLYEQANKVAQKIKVDDECYVVGSWITYPLAIYGSAKLFEVLGIKSRHSMLEQFCHMDIFSLRRSDSVIILANRKDGHELYSKLENNGYKVYLCQSEGRNLEEKLLYHVFLLQLIALQNANRKKISECYFITNKKIRDISSSLIY